MRLLVLLALAGFLAAGCESDQVAGPPAPTPQKLAWVATFTGSADGTLVLDLVQTGTSLAGEAIISPDVHVWVQGTMQSDSMILADDPTRRPAPGVSMRARILTNGDLSGTLEVSSIGLDADVTGRTLPRKELRIDRTVTLSETVKAMAWDGASVWLSTSTNDYVRMDAQGAIRDTIVIFLRPGVHWTSAPLMFDGANLWGVYPITILGPGGTTNVADLLSFNTQGRTSDSLRLAHRPHGLVHDGVHPWSLRADPAALVRFDGLAAVIDSLPVAIPDAYDLAFDGTHFWTTGWFLRRLYELDRAGNVVAIAELPTRPGSLPSGLTFDQSALWYGDGIITSTTLYRMTLP